MEGGSKMRVLETLKKELTFLRNGGYRHPEQAKWRAHYIFEDSPTCLNFGDPERAKECSECALFAYVPETSRGKTVPCRYIPLNEKGETLDSLYRASAPEEIEAAVAAWLEQEIERLEKEDEKDFGHATSAG